MGAAGAHERRMGGAEGADPHFLDRALEPVQVTFHTEIHVISFVNHHIVTHANFLCCACPSYFNHH